MEVILYVLCILVVCAAFIILIVLKDQVEELRKLQLRVEKLEKERDMEIPNPNVRYWCDTHVRIPRDFVICALLDKAKIIFEHPKVDSPTKWQVRNS